MKHLAWLVPILVLGACTEAHCEYEGTQYAFGESWTGTDGCSTCWCEAKGPVCSQTPCTGDVVASDDVTSDDDATGTTCVDNGTTHAAGESWASTDGCNTCYCESDGVVACTTTICGAVCEWEGDRYAEGASWPAGDGCNRCYCQGDGAVACSHRTCGDVAQ